MVQWIKYFSMIIISLHITIAYCILIALQYEFSNYPCKNNLRSL